MHVCPRKTLLFLVAAGLIGTAAWPVRAASTPTGASTTGMNRQGDPAPAPPSYGKVRPTRSAGSQPVQRASWLTAPSTPQPRFGYVPRHQRVPAGFASNGEPDLAPPEIIEQVEPDFQLSTAEPEWGDPGCVDGGCCGECGDPGCDSCDPCGSLCIPMCCLPVPCISFRHLSFEFGVHGFRGPFNGVFNGSGLDGSFGFHYGANWGLPVPVLARHGLGFQLGAGLTHSNLSGSISPNLDHRHQFFATVGAFRRVDWGLQGGFVIDYYHEDWIMMVDMFQLRGELSWLDPCMHEYGFRFATNVQGDDAQVAFLEPDPGGHWRTTDYYTFFYRKRFPPCGGAEGRLFAGWTGQADGLLGLDAHIPLSDCWALNTGFTYLIPNEGRSEAGVLNESWNVGITFVWYPNGRARVAKRTCFEPLFEVANNGNLFVDLERIPQGP